MDLSEFGYNDWCRENYRDLLPPAFQAARVTRVDKDRYMVRNEVSEVVAEVTGKLMFSANSSQDLPCVGDWVSVQYYDNGQLAIIHMVLPRRSFLRRKSPGPEIEYQMIASNIDIAFIMQSCDQNFNIRRLERYIVMAHDGNVQPVILLSKSDLINPEELAVRVKQIQDLQLSNTEMKIIPFSNQTENGIRTVWEELQPGKTYCLLGSSGVGKTTLLNHLLGHVEFATQPVREVDHRGKHTTTRRQLTLLKNGAMIIDTPGMRELGLIISGDDNGTADSIQQSFSDITKLSQQCRFNNCSHTTEADCAILQALTSGALDRDRYKNYLKIKKESEFHEASYAARRKRDKAFGKKIKTRLEDLKKYGKS